MLELKNLRLTAEDGQGKVDILKDVSLSVADGEFLVITGPNGGGKTSLAKNRDGPPCSRAADKFSGTART